MGWDRHKLLWDENGTDKYVPWTTLGLSMGMSFLWESHRKRPMGWDKHKLLWDGKGTDKYVPWSTLVNRGHSKHGKSITIPTTGTVVQKYNLLYFSDLPSRINVLRVYQI